MGSLDQRLLKLEAKVRSVLPVAAIIYRVMEPGSDGKPRLVQTLRREPDGQLVEMAA